MTEKQYLEQVKEIRRHIANGRLERADKLLAEMYACKPVRLMWFVAKAEYVLKKEKDPAAALKVLDGERFSEARYFLGEDYPGLRACMKFRIDTLQKMGRKRDAIREGYRYQRACGKGGGQLEQALAAAVAAFAEEPESGSALNALADAFYHTADMVSYFIVRMAMLRQGLLQEDDRSGQFYQLPNFGYLEERICAEEPATFVLAMDGHLGPELEVLGFLLHSMGHKVYLLSPPLPFETEEQLDLGDTLAVSLDNAEQYPDMCVIPPVALARDGVPYGDNRDHIINHICRNESGNGLALLLCSGELLDALYRDGPLRGRLGRLSAYETDFQEEKLQFGWAGSYLSYISGIYGYDVRTDIEAKPEVGFSIVIPARNSAYTLRHTLETCLNQRYRGSYEILVCDNSVEGSTEVYDLCRELDDPRIRYVKAPRSLYLAKSFEFAYLQARGEFVFSIGSDDGVMPWALDVLRRILDQFPDEEVVLWERGFYVWSGFKTGQENMLEIPRKYARGQINVFFETAEEILGRVAQDRQQIYAMPLLYINSGFRRRYLKTLLKKTGKLLDGSCQDLQTGIVNCCVNERVLGLLYPLTIAGMNSLSVGYLANRPDTKRERETAQSIRRKVFQLDNAGIHVPLKRERLVPTVLGDDYALYLVLSRAVEEGLLPAEKSDRVLDWQAAVSGSIGFQAMLGDGFDRFIHSARFMSRKVGQEQRAWFEKEVYSKALAPRYRVREGDLEKLDAEKSYQEGPNPAGGEILDASKHDVRNIAQAVKLFAQRTQL